MNKITPFITPRVTSSIFDIGFPSTAFNLIKQDQARRGKGDNRLIISCYAP